MEKSSFDAAATDILCEFFKKDPRQAIQDYGISEQQQYIDEEKQRARIVRQKEIEAEKKAIAEREKSKAITTEAKSPKERSPRTFASPKTSGESLNKNTCQELSGEHILHLFDKKNLPRLIVLLNEIQEQGGAFFLYRDESSQSTPNQESGFYDPFALPHTLTPTSIETPLLEKRHSKLEKNALLLYSAKQIDFSDMPQEFFTETFLDVLKALPNLEKIKYFGFLSGITPGRSMYKKHDFITILSFKNFLNRYYNSTTKTLDFSNGNYFAYGECLKELQGCSFLEGLSLDLSNNGLEVFPPFLNESWRRRTNLEGNPCFAFDVIPALRERYSRHYGALNLSCMKELFDPEKLQLLQRSGLLTGLQQLDLSSNDLSKIPEILTQPEVLKTVKYLNLSKNNLSIFPMDLLRKMPQLKTLIIAGNEAIIENWHKGIIEIDREYFLRERPVGATPKFNIITQNP
jgi:hypothetical protein